MKPCGDCGEITETRVPEMENRMGLSPKCPDCYAKHYRSLTDLMIRQMDYRNELVWARRKRDPEDLDADRQFLSFWRTTTRNMHPERAKTEMYEAEQELDAWKARRGAQAGGKRRRGGS